MAYPNHFDADSDSPYVCRKCGSSHIRTIERGYSHADIVIGDASGAPEIEDYPDGVEHEDIDWETIGYRCADCDWEENEDEGGTLADLVCPRAEWKPRQESPVPE